MSNTSVDVIPDFDTITEAIERKSVSSKTEVGICKLCGVAMMVEFNGEYKCPECGIIEHIGTVQDYDDKNISGYRIVSTTGGYRHYYGTDSNYARKQEKDIGSQLDELASQYRGPAIPHHIRVKAGQWYNDIQKILISTPDGEKKFVKRGDIKDEVLGKLIKYECDRACIARMDKEIAEFMRLPSAGLSRGESILRQLHNQGKIELPINIDPTEGFIERYLESLDINKPHYKDFIAELIQVANTTGVGLRSIANSKVVGVIWVLVQKEKLPITLNELDKKCNIRRNTFLKFSVAITDKMHKFVNVFEKYNIPHGVIIRRL
jgi:hypothetical protein